MSYNQNLYEDDEKLDHTLKTKPYQTNGIQNEDTLDRNTANYNLNQDKQSPNIHNKMAHKPQQPAPFYSAINPLDYYQEFEEEKTNSNQFRRLAEQHKYNVDCDEELKYDEAQLNQDQKSSISCDELDPDEKLSSYSEDNQADMSQNNSNFDKPRSIASFTNNINGTY